MTQLCNCRKYRTVCRCKRTSPLDEAINKLRAGKALSSRDLTMISTNIRGIIELMKRGMPPSRP